MNAHAPIYGAEERQEERAATLSGLMGLLLVSLRVARSSQPWAERCNPFGIERNGPAPQKLVALGFQARRRFDRRGLSIFHSQRTWKSAIQQVWKSALFVHNLVASTPTHSTGVFSFEAF